MGGTVPGSLYLYAPTKGISAAIAVLFSLSGIAHLWQNNLKHKSFSFGLLLIWGTILYAVGLGFREYAADGHHYGNVTVFVISTVTIFIGPPVYMGVNYIILGRTLFYVPYLSPIHPGRVVTTFVALDAFIGALSGAGVALVANSAGSASKLKRGSVLVKASLFLQIGCFFLFVALIAVFHARCARTRVLNRNIRVLMTTLYTSCGLVFVRNVYRVVEAFEPVESGLNTSEVPFWVLDVLPLLLNTYLLNVFPPASYLPKTTKIYLAKDGKTELEGPGWVDTRPFLVTVMDPFDLGSLITGKEKKEAHSWDGNGVGAPQPIMAPGRDEEAFRPLR